MSKQDKILTLCGLALMIVVAVSFIYACSQLPPSTANNYNVDDIRANTLYRSEGDIWKLQKQHAEDQIKFQVLEQAVGDLQQRVKKLEKD